MSTNGPLSRAGFRAATIVAVLTCSTGSLAARQVREDRLRVLDDTTIVQRVELLDGTKLFGRIARIDGTQILFRTMGGLEIGFQRRYAWSGANDIEENSGRQIPATPGCSWPRLHEYPATDTGTPECTSWSFPRSAWVSAR